MYNPNDYDVARQLMEERVQIIARGGRLQRQRRRRRQGEPHLYRSAIQRLAAGVARLAGTLRPGQALTGGETGCPEPGGC